MLISSKIKTSWLEAMKVVEKTRNQKKLAKIAQETKFRQVWESAVAKITDQKVLYGLAVNQENISAAALAVRKLTDQAQLRQIAASMQYDQDIRRIAIDHLEDQHLIEQIARTDPNGRVRGTAYANLSDPLLQAQLAGNDPDNENRRWAARKLDNQAMLIYLAQNDKSDDIRKIAISRIQDDMTRARIALWDPAADIDDREEALKLLKPDEATLETLILQYDGYAFIGAALPLIQDEDRLMRIAQGLGYHSDAVVKRITDREKLLALAADQQTVEAAVDQIQKLKMLDEEAITHIHPSYPRESLEFELEVAAFLRRLEDIPKGQAVSKAFLERNCEDLTALATPEAVESLILLLREQRYGRGRHRIGNVRVTPLAEQVIRALNTLWHNGGAEIRQSVRKANGISFPEHEDNGARDRSCHWDVAPITLQYEY